MGIAAKVCQGMFSVGCWATGATPLSKIKNPNTQTSRVVCIPSCCRGHEFLILICPRVAPVRRLGQHPTNLAAGGGGGFPLSCVSGVVQRS